MKDGIIKADGTSRRVKATFPATYEEFRAQAAAGTLSLDVLFQAAGWSQQPTFLNKGALLQDETAALFGLNEAGVPNQALAFLGKYNQHWWQRRTYIVDTGYVENQKEPDEWDGWLLGYTSSSLTIQYADKVEIDTDGSVSLVSPKSFTVTLNNASEADNILPGKYLYFWGKYWYLPSTSGIYDFYDDESYNNYVGVSGDIFNVTAKYYDSSVIGEWESIWSMDREAYPDSGILDNYEYLYVGIPYQNFVNLPSKMEFGSYIGTGTYGDDNPCILTFGFVPKIWGVYSFYSASDKYKHTLNNLIPFGQDGKTRVNWEFNSNTYISFKYSGVTVSWSNTLDNVQLNEEGSEYYYFAIG